MSIRANVRAKRRIPFLQVLKSIGAALAAWLIAAPLFQTDQPVFAAIAAIIVVQPSVNASLGKALERSTATIIGVAIALGASLIFGSPPWLVLIAIAAAITTGWAFKLTPATANQIAISAMLSIVIGAATPDYALIRILETVLGAVIGIIINAVIVPPVALAPAKNAVGTLGGNIAQVLEDLGAVLSRRTSGEVLNDVYWRARHLRAELTAAQARVTSLQESLRFNMLRRSKHRPALDTLANLLERLAVLTTRTIGIARAIRDKCDDSLTTDANIGEISDELKRAGHDLRIVVRDAGLDAVTAPHPTTHEMPALTKPIRLSRPSSKNWVLEGFLVENLRLVNEEITGILTEE
ncbi:unannotated protein [freshwater metagenome]|uniref:Unannotated protein n=1 Tax=freshwater metagenome TaxID=449393 RepID=A0A6J7GB88_9ZZZZ